MIYSSIAESNICFNRLDGFNFVSSNLDLHSGSFGAATTTVTDDDKLYEQKVILDYLPSPKKIGEGDNDKGDISR